MWWPAWVGRGVFALQGVVVAGLWPILLWALGSALLWVAGHTLRLLIVATGFRWLGVACCAADVLLDGNRERTGNQAAYAYLAAHGVQVRWADPRYPPRTRRS